MRISIALIIAATLMASFSRPSAAAEPLTMSVSTGFDGVTRLGTWLPLRVDVSNRGAEIAGEIEIQVDTPAERSSADTPSYIRSIAVTLSQYSQKRFAFDIFVPAATSHVTARIVSQGSVLLEQDVPLQVIPSGELLCGVLARGNGALDFLGGIPLTARQRNAHVSHVEATDLPANPQSLAPLDCLIIANPSTVITPSQGEAIQVWVAAGGVLVVTGGNAAQRTMANLPEETLPVKPSGLVPVGSLQHLVEFLGLREGLTAGPWLVSGADVTDGTALVEEDDVPILVAARRGAGSVFYLALDPLAEPLFSWSGSKDLWRYVLSQAPASAASPNVASRRYSGWGRAPRQALSDFASNKAPSPNDIAVIILVYGLVAVPASYLAFRGRRSDLGALTLIGLTTITTVVAFATANANRQPDVLVNEITLVHQRDDASTALAHSYISLVALKTMRRDISLPANALAQGLFYPMPQTRLRDQEKWALRVAQGGKTALQQVDLPQNRLNTVAVDGQVSNVPVVADLQAKGPRITGTISNQSNVGLRDAAVVVGGQIVALGGIGPGESKSIEIDLSAGPVELSESIVSLAPDVSRASGRDAMIREILESALTASYSSYARLDLGAISLIGWLEDDPQPIGLQDAKVAQTHHSLLVVSLPIHLDKGEWARIPPALIERRPMSVSLGAKLQSRNWTLLAGETAAMEFTLPLTAKEFQVDRLSVDIRGTVGGVGNAAVAQALGSAFLFDWQKADWAGVLPDQESLANPQRFVSPLGLVRLRYTFHPPSALELTRIDMSSFDIGVGGQAL